MARKLRIQYAGAIYHVMSRGDHGEDIFRGGPDRESFLLTLGQACEKTDWQIHAWCLMRNHFHLVLETPQPNLVAGMKWFLGTYTGRFNRRHHLLGHLFSGRYKALLVEGSGNGYLKTVCDYVHLNPVRARLLPPEERLTTYRWSSYPEYLRGPSERRPWLRVDRLLGEHGIQRDSSAGREQFEKRMEARRLAEEGKDPAAELPGWCIGSKAFRQELLEQMSQRAGPEHYGRELRESAEEKANRITAEELSRLGWQEADLARRRKGDPGKITIAARLRSDTTMTLAWIAARLGMGTRTYLAHLLYWRGRGGKAASSRKVSA
jgi:REP element-mobilizing transposase RayT